MGRRKISPKELVSVIPNVVLLFKDLLKDPRVPRSSKALLVGTVAYIVSPVDLLPDFVPFIGQVDDAVLAALVASGVAAKKEQWRRLPLLPVVFVTLHLAYGIGFLFGLMRFGTRWRGREEDSNVVQPETRVS